MNRPKDALRATAVPNTENGWRMRHDPKGGWVRAEDYDQWRAYALALECQVVQLKGSVRCLINEARKEIA